MLRRGELDLQLQQIETFVSQYENVNVTPGTMSVDAAIHAISNADGIRTRLQYKYYEAQATNTECGRRLCARIEAAYAKYTTLISNLQKNIHHQH